MADNEGFDFKYSHKRESESIEGRKHQGIGAMVMVVGAIVAVMGLFQGPTSVGDLKVTPLGMLGVLLGVGIFAWGKIQEWAAKR